MILTVVGGSAQSTPVLAAALACAAPACRIELRLAGRDRRRLHAVQRACNLLTQGTGTAAEIADESEWESALAGSDVVLIQTRIGGYAGREFDESFPLAFGIPGDEGLGPGGLSAAFRAWPAMHDVLAQVRRCAPRAETLLLSSPSSLLLRLAAVAFPGWDLKGICELPWTTLRNLCAPAGLDAVACAFSYVGVNHLGFLYDVGNDTDLLEKFSEGNGKAAFPSPALVSSLHAFPLKYLRLHFCPDEVVREQRSQRTPRAQQLASIAEEAFVAFTKGDKPAILHALGARTADWYTEAVVPWLLPRLGIPVRQPVFLSMADAEGDVRERAYRSSPEGWRALDPARPAPREAAAIVERFAMYEQAAAHAVLAGTAASLARPLSLHPWVGANDARALATQIVQQPVSLTAKESVAWSN